MHVADQVNFIRMFAVQATIADRPCFDRTVAADRYTSGLLNRLQASAGDRLAAQHQPSAGDVDSLSLRGQTKPYSRSWEGKQKRHLSRSQDARDPSGHLLWIGQRRVDRQGNRAA